MDVNIFLLGDSEGQKQTEGDSISIIIIDVRYCLSSYYYYRQKCH